MAKGLSTQFTLSDGRFILTDGAEKARDEIKFYTTFDRFRVYLSDFGSNFISLLQKPASYLQANSTILLGVYKRGIEKYVKNVKVSSLDVGYIMQDRKTHVVKIEYSVKEESKTEIQDVIFI